MEAASFHQVFQLCSLPSGPCASAVILNHLLRRAPRLELRLGQGHAHYWHLIDIDSLRMAALRTIAAVPIDATTLMVMCGLTIDGHPHRLTLPGATGGNSSRDGCSAPAD